MRIIEGIVHPAVVIMGWLIALIALSLIAKYKSDFSNQELSHLAALGGFVFVVQSFAIIPFHFIPFVIFTLSGITFIITVAGVSRGILVGSAAMILNHFLIPGSLSMLGTNLSNMIITGLLIGWLPSQFYRSPYIGKKIKYIVSFIGGLLYTIIEGLMVIFEIVIFYNSESNVNIIGVGFIVYIILLGIIEGLFTAIVVSYYYHSFQPQIPLKIAMDMEEDEKDTSIQKIDFHRFVRVQQIQNDAIINFRRSDFE